MVKVIKPHIDQEYKKLCYSHNKTSRDNRTGLPSLSEKGSREEELVWKLSCGYEIVPGNQSSLHGKRISQCLTLPVKPKERALGLRLLLPRSEHRGQGVG